VSLCLFGFYFEKGAFSSSNVFVTQKLPATLSS